jgi:hypothetical protein
LSHLKKMNIHSVRPEIAAEAAKAQPKPKNATTQTEGVVRDSYLPVKNEDLMDALRNEPEVRPEVVERAKLLVADPDYPPKEVLKKVAEALLEQEPKQP